MACRRGPKFRKLFDLRASIGVILGEYLVYGGYVGIMEKNMEISRMGYIRFRGYRLVCGLGWCLTQASGSLTILLVAGVDNFPP